MARPIYPHEMADPDFQWLLNNYKEFQSGYFVVDISCLPIVLVPSDLGDVSMGANAAGLDPSALASNDVDLDLEDEKDFS